VAKAFLGSRTGLYLRRLESVILANVLYALLLLAVAANLASAAYVLLAIRRVDDFQGQNGPFEGFQPPVTILKPVCGLDATLYENLRSFCVQSYPEYQVVFGVRQASDPAVAVIEKLFKDLPGVDAVLVVDETVAGPNLKVSNLGNMYKSAKHSYVVIADSDMRVDEHYVSSVVAPFEDAQVGAVTCLYSGSSVGGLPSLLASMFINEWFLPSVLVSTRLNELRFGLGATIAVRRELLDAIGGFNTLSHFLADDHMLGKLISEHGFRVVLSNYVVKNIVHEQSLGAMLRHELRWARTIRSVAPLGHAFSFFMYGVPLALLGAVMIELTFDWEIFEFAIVALPLLLRVWMHFTVRRKLGLARGDQSLWLLPLRDVLCLLIWGTSFLGRKINWKQMRYTVDPKGLMSVAEVYEP
jgi:ceramide glucosyltransferase